MDLSIIITAHHEGLVAHKTVLSLLENLERISPSVTYEIIIGLDSPNDGTKDYFGRYKDDSRFDILTTDFRDPSQNRNNAVRHSTGEFIMLIDGDDMVSPSFIKTALDLAQNSKKPILIHPEAHLQFGVDEPNCTLWICQNSFSKEKDALIMCYWNRWTNVQFGRREIFIDHPFVPATNGYGFEDFQFNSETRADDIRHLVAPETIAFYRKKSESVQSQHIHHRAVVPKTKLLDLDYIKSLSTKNLPIPTKQSSVRRVAYSSYRTAQAVVNKIEPIKNLLTPIARKALHDKKVKVIPIWLIREWKNINHIENQLYPTVGEIAKLEFHPLSFRQNWTEFGVVFKQLADQVSRRPDYLFLPPEIKVGGTEKLMFNYVKALSLAHPNWQVAIIGKRPPEGLFDIPEKVDFIDFDDTTKNLTTYEKSILWDRFFIQLDPSRIHIVNNKRWLTWARQHRNLLEKNNFRLYVSLFMREFTHEKGRILTLADPEIREAWQAIDKVFTDNQNVIDETLSNNAFEPEKFAVHYQPQDLKDINKPKVIDPKKTIRILWASRISFQKRPDILKEIANRLGDNFIVDAYGAIEKNQFKPDYFSGSKVNYKGSFNGIDSIPTQEYGIYLYTSETDGIPNILLEISSKGLPIVASDVGGIKEFVKHGQTGLLVDMKNISGYTDALNQLASNPEKAKQLTKNSQKLLKEQHSWESFIEQIKTDVS